MRRILVAEDYLLSGGFRIVAFKWRVKHSHEFPDGIEYSIQLLKQIEDYYMQIMRIDNQMHKSRPGAHIHKDDRIIWCDMDFKEARNYLERYASANRNC